MVKHGVSTYLALRLDAQRGLEALIDLLHQAAGEVANRVNGERLVDHHQVLALDHGRESKARFTALGSRNIDRKLRGRSPRNESGCW